MMKVVVMVMIMPSGFSGVNSQLKSKRIHSNSLINQTTLQKGACQQDSTGQRR